MNYEKAWEKLKENFLATLMDPPELGKEKEEVVKCVVLAGIATMQKLEELYAEEKDDRATDRQRVEN